MTAQFLFITAQIGYHCTLELGMLNSAIFRSFLLFFGRFSVAPLSENFSADALVWNYVFTVWV